MTKSTKENKAFDPSQLKVVKKITIPTIQQEDGKDYYVVLKSKFYDGKDRVDPKTGELGKFADVIRVIDLEGDHTEEKELIANTILRSQIEKAFPEHSYVDVAIRFRREKVAGKRYKDYSIDAIENPLS